MTQGLVTMVRRVSRVGVIGVGILPVIFCAAAGVPNNGAVTRLQRLVTTDQQAVTTAQTDLDTATRAYSDAVEKRTRDFEHSPDLKSAQKAVTDDVNALETARRQVLATLHDSPAYTEAAAKRAAAKANAEAVAQRASSPDQLAAANRELDRLDALLNALEQSALDSDPTIKTARENLAAANATLRAMKDKFAAGATSDPELTRLKAARDAAEQKLTTAQAKLDADRARMVTQSRGG